MSSIYDDQDWRTLLAESVTWVADLPAHLLADSHLYGEIVDYPLIPN